MFGSFANGETQIADFVLRTLLDKIRDGVVIIDEDYRTLAANKRFSDMTGYSRDELYGMHPWDWDHLFSEKDIRNLSPSVTTTDTSIESIIRRKDGTLFNVEVAATGATIDGQKLLLGIVRDISQRKQSEILIRAKEAADLANKAKSAFLANMSHELRTPLTAILGLAELCKLTTDPAKLSKNLDMLSASANTLLNLIGDMLDLSRVEAGKLSLEAKEFNLQDFMGQTVSSFRSSCQKKELGLSFSIDEGVPQELTGDTVRLGQVLSNLIGNAVKFTSHGFITIRADVSEVLPDGQIELRFKVTDTGIGIPPDLVLRP